MDRRFATAIRVASAFVGAYALAILTFAEPFGRIRWGG